MSSNVRSLKNARFLRRPNKRNNVTNISTKKEEALEAVLSPLKIVETIRRVAETLEEIVLLKKVLEGMIIVRVGTKLVEKEARTDKIIMSTDERTLATLGGLLW
jgi:hypothetical protein